tara:strand:+ start:138 stop:329 length:192 start_codon:yes stop_codon:yes gene_type:complete
MNEVALQVQKAILWQEAKGKLIALLEVEGHRRLVAPGESEKFEPLAEAIGAFISAIEDDELQC